MRILVASQVYPPDPASVGQHLADTAAALAARHHRVVVLTSNRGYNDPRTVYPARETRDGVDVRRLPLSSFGKSSIAARLAAGLLFLVQVIARGLFMPRLDTILVSTSPPLCSVAALVIGSLRRVRIVYWVMDLNPDQMVAMGWIKATSPFVRLFDWLNRRILRRADHVVVLDRFMAERLLRKADVSAKMTVMPPWPHEGHLEIVEHDDNPFRQEHGLDGKFVVMYSGNHSLCTPLKTILDAALRLRDDPDLVFMFIGDGTGKKEVDDTIALEEPPNIRSLPYQPLDSIKYSLSAADVHLVVVGPTEVGVRHPCKVYGAMALARPVLLLGPDPCHASDLVADHEIGWHIQHGDVDSAVSVLRQLKKLKRGKLQEMGRRAQRVIEQELSQEILCGRMVAIVEGDGAGARRHEGTKGLSGAIPEGR